MRTFNHVGIVTTESKEGAVYNEGLSVWLTDYSKSPNRIEFLKFEKGSCLPELVQTNGHIAYTVPCLEKELEGKKVIFGPAVCDEHLTIAFIEEEGIAIEIMELKKFINLKEDNTMSDIKTKFINDPENITAELLEGYALAYPNQVKLAAENIVVRANPKGNDKVAIVTLGGSGHEPALSGFVGEGMLDCSVVGDVFAAPGAQRLFQALQLMDREAGILLVVLNHSGDVMSANMACQLAARKGIKVKKLLTHDDISAGIGANVDDRRGLAGCVPLYKILGAAAEEGKSLDELIEIGERYNKNVATLAVAMRSCTHPQNGGTITNLPDGIMEIGMGQHGEGGGGQKPLVSADDTAAEMVDLLCQQLQPKAGDKMLLIINGVGATTHMELNIIFRKAYKELEARGLQVVVSRIQEILTVQEQAGFQMIMAILDEDHIDYLNNKRADAPYWTTLGK